MVEGEGGRVGFYFVILAEMGEGSVGFCATLRHFTPQGVNFGADLLVAHHLRNRSGVQVEGKQK